MINVLLDELPTAYETEDGRLIPIDADFRVGIQVTLAQDDPDLTDAEKARVIVDLILSDPEEGPKTEEEAAALVEWYMSGWHHDNPSDEESGRRLMDFDVDQWRIYAAFRDQYGIDLNDENLRLHWWAFMGLLTSLEECAYTRVIDIRQRKISGKMAAEDRKALRKAKAIYELNQTRGVEDAEFEAHINDLLGTPTGAKEAKRVEEFEKWADDGGDSVVG